MKTITIIKQKIKVTTLDHISSAEQDEICRTSEQTQSQILSQKL